MARKLTLTEVNNILQVHQYETEAQFILEVVQIRKEFHLRLKGKNGEIVMHQEQTSYQNARYMAARLISAGMLRCRYKESIINNSSCYTKYVRYATFATHKKGNGK